MPGGSPARVSPNGIKGKNGSSAFDVGDEDGLLAEALSIVGDDVPAPRALRLHLE